jgi:Fe-S-cluster containining protein
LKFPAIAFQTYNRLKNNPKFLALTEFMLRTLRPIVSPIERAKLVHQFVDDCNEEVMKNPIVKQYSGCHRGCSGCCHTEVSVTPDEADLLAMRVQEGVTIDTQKLYIQKKVIESKESYYSLPYNQRACVFLGETGECRVYEDRPSVCRTNAVLGDSSQCSTVDGQMKEMRLVKTEHADMVIMGAFMHQHTENGLLPEKLWEALFAIKNSKVNNSKKRQVFKEKKL